MNASPMIFTLTSETMLLSGQDAPMKNDGLLDLQRDSDNKLTGPKMRIADTEFLALYLLGLDEL